MRNNEELHSLPVGAMSVDQFARWAGIGRTSAWAQIKFGKPKAVKLGNRTLVRLKDAEAWLDNLPGLRNSGAQ
jgi:hypothetical protein